MGDCLGQRLEWLWCVSVTWCGVDGVGQACQGVAVFGEEGSQPLPTPLQTEQGTAPPRTQRRDRGIGGVR